MSRKNSSRKCWKLVVMLTVCCFNRNDVSGSFSRSKPMNTQTLTTVYLCMDCLDNQPVSFSSLQRKNRYMSTRSDSRLEATANFRSWLSFFSTIYSFLLEYRLYVENSLCSCKLLSRCLGSDTANRRKQSPDLIRQCFCLALTTET